MRRGALGIKRPERCEWKNGAMNVERDRVVKRHGRRYQRIIKLKGHRCPRSIKCNFRRQRNDRKYRIISSVNCDKRTSDCALDSVRSATRPCVIERAKIGKREHRERRRRISVAIHRRTRVFVARRIFGYSVVARKSSGISRVCTDCIARSAA